MAGQNSFLVCFEAEEDLEVVMKGRPWLFQKQLIVFDRLTETVDREKIQLVESPYWIKIGSYPLECDCKYLMHVVGSTFRGNSFRD